MKKSFATILAVCTLAVSAGAQGTFVIDSAANTGDGAGPFASTGGLVWISLDGVHVNLDTTIDINLGVLWGTTSGGATNHLNIDPLGLNTGAYASSGNWIASQATGGSDITGYASGALLDINGNSYIVPGEAAGTTIFLILQGWTGNDATYAAALGDLNVPTGQTGPFSITLQTASNPTQPDVRNMPSLLVTIDPEPSVPLLSGLAALAFALFRRKK